MPVSSYRSLGARIALLAGVGFASLGLSACATSGRTVPGGSGPVRVVAAENIWGDLAAQVGGADVRVHNIINSPDADPHDYEPSTADGTAIHSAALVILNGVGYDGWAGKLIAANGVAAERVLNVGDVTAHVPGDNPHRWYSPADVNIVIDNLVSRLSAVDPTQASEFRTGAAHYRTGPLSRYTDLIATIRAQYAGVPIGASESIVAPMADALGLVVKTPASFLSAISEGGEPTIQDKQTIDRQIARREIKVYVYNSQNATPDVARQVSAARANSIPVVTFTETLTPAGSTFVDWQVRQLEALRAALASVAGR